MILINRTFEETTPESAEDGEFSDSGFISEDVEYTFTELVRLLKDHPEASRSPASGAIYEWYSTDWFVDDYQTGTDRRESVHYSSRNPWRNDKYWRLAAKAAGIVK